MAIAVCAPWISAVVAVAFVVAVAVSVRCQNMGEYIEYIDVAAEHFLMCLSRSISHVSYAHCRCISKWILFCFQELAVQAVHPGAWGLQSTDASKCLTSFKNEGI